LFKFRIIFFSSLLLSLSTVLLAQNSKKERDSLQLVLNALPVKATTVDSLMKKARKLAWTDLQLAELYTRTALSYAQDLNYLKGLAESKYQLGLLFKDYDFKIAETLTLEALEHSKSINDSALMGKIYNTIGNLQDNVDETEKAEKYYNRALDIFAKIGADSLRAKVYNNLGIIYDNRQQYDTARFFYKQSAAIHLQKKNYLGLAINYLNQGYCFELDGNYDSCIQYLNQSQSLAIKFDYQRLLPYIYNNFSELYLKQKNYFKAINEGSKGLEQARIMQNRIQEKNALSLLKQAYIQSNNLQKAYECAEEIINVNDSINQYKKLKEIDLLEMRYAFEQERMQQQFERELLKSELRQKELTMILISVVAGLIILIMVFLYVFQHNRIKRKNLEQRTIQLEKENLKQQLDFKNKELTTSGMYLLKKNEFITNIANKLKNTDLDNESQKERAINRIITEMEKSISDDSWADFEVRFQEVHTDFYNSLSKKFPELTANELRLCAFLKLNMTSKEIAGLTYQSVDSLKTARYRLRKKLGLNREDNLVAFLTRI